MSIKLMSAIFETEMRELSYDKNDETRNTKPSTAKLVLLAIADHANDYGESAYPGFDKLQRKTGLSRGGLSDTILALEQNGLLVIDKRGSRLGTNSYTINIKAFPPMYKETEDLPELVYPVDSEESTHKTQESLPSRPEPSVKPSVKLTKKEGAKAPKPKTPEKPKPLKANQIPQIILFREVTRRYPSTGSQFTVITSVDKVGDRLGRDAIADDLLPFYREWCDRAYNPLSVKWLSEWAVSGNIPQNGRKSQTQPQGVSVAQSWLQKRQAVHGND